MQHFPCTISEDVYHEVVTQGKAFLYEDAFAIEKILEGKIKVARHRRKTHPSDPKVETLGRGECSTMALYLRQKHRIIVSDDRAFIAYLQHKKIPYMVPVLVIVQLVYRGKMKIHEGKQALKRIKPYVRREVYELALEQLKSLHSRRKLWKRKKRLLVIH